MLVSERDYTISTEMKFKISRKSSIGLPNKSSVMERLFLLVFRMMVWSLIS